MKKSALTALLVLLFSMSLSADVWDTGFKTQSSSGIDLSWKTDKDFIYVKVSAPTEGWIAVGFGATSAMKDANIIMGYVSGKDTVLEDQFGTGLFTHKKDTDLGGSDSIVEKSGTVKNKVTELRFKLKLDSGDKFDVPLVPGKPVNVILSYRNDTNMTNKHSVRTKLQITL
ncbi:MAG: hypothetical protein E4H36_07035 [Spirochaetales bacterium]|nr:MAG: hypothetical protein E4H36_07035 [Spirochaetales bacterium]